MERVMTVDNVYLSSHCLKNNTKEKKLDVMKLRKLFTKFGFNPTARGTYYIIEELEYFFNNNISEMKNLNTVYSISAKIHNTSIKNIQWDVEASIKTMNKHKNKELIKSIFYWYEEYKCIQPRLFMYTMLEYLNYFEDKFNENS